MGVFEELRTRLESIDELFGDTSGFSDDFLERRTDEVVNLELNNARAKYQVLEVEVTEGDKTYTETYLRGFDEIMSQQSSLAKYFMSELARTMRDIFVLESTYFFDGSGKEYASYSVDVSDEAKLTVRVLGGGRYRFGEDCIHTDGYAPTYQTPFDKLDDFLSKRDALFDKLVTGDTPYNGLKVQHKSLMDV